MAGNPDRSTALKTVGIIGLGLMGGSLGLALRRHGAAWRVVGWNRSARAAERALQIGAIDDACASPSDAAAQSDLLVLALPPDRIIEMLRAVKPALREGCVATDVAGAKARIVREASELLGAAFVGGHPMAGCERAGIDAAHAALYEGATWILTPDDQTSPAALAAVEDLVRAAGARPFLCGATEHDRWIAAISHLPHIVAYGLVDAAEYAGAPAGIAAGSFRDGTRVAASDPGAWTGILLDNATDVVRSLDGLTLWLGAVRDAIACRDSERLQNLLAEAHTAKLARGESGAIANG